MALSPRAEQLRTLADQVPAANQQVAQGLQQGRLTSLQSQVGGTAPAAATSTAAQGLGTEQAAATGNIQINQAKTNQQQLGQVAQQGVAQGQQENQAAKASASVALQGTQTDNAARLSKLSESSKNELLDKQLDFSKSQAQLGYLNQRQLADWAVTKAKTANDLKAYQQMSSEMADRKGEMLQAAHNKIQQELDNNTKSQVVKLDNATTMALEKQKKDLEAAIAKQKADAKNQATIWTMAGGVVGGVVGGIYGGPTGAGVGYAAGSGLGAMAGSATSGS